MDSEFGYEYPAGASQDPYAPWNDEVCDTCGYTYDLDELNDEGICASCSAYETQ